MTNFIDSSTYNRGMHDAMQDRCENAPFASVGGLDKRSNMSVPHYISKEDTKIYLAGYKEYCKNSFGADWETCEFGWSKVFMIGDN